MVRSRSSSRWICGSFISSLLVPVIAAATPAEAEHVDVEREEIEGDQLRERAGSLDASGNHVEAAKIWEQLIDTSSEPRERMHAYMHAAHAWMAASRSTGAVDLREAAVSVLRRALVDEAIDPRAREEFASTLEEIEHALPSENADAPRVRLLDPRVGLSAPVAGSGFDSPPGVATSQLGVATSRSSDSTPFIADNPPRSPLTIAGGVTLALAAPLLGGLTYALLVDREITRQVAGMTEYDPVRLGRLEDSAREVQGMAIGFGIASATLATAGIGLVIAGHRRKSLRTGSVTLLPQGTAGRAELALVGRF